MLAGSAALLDHGTKVGPTRPVGTGGKSRSLKNPYSAVHVLPDLAAIAFTDSALERGSVSSQFRLDFYRFHDGP